MNTKSLATIFSVIFAVATIGGFFWLWQMSNDYDKNPPVADNLKIVEVESVKKDAENILNGLGRNSDIPIPVPSSKMGKDNPFAGI